MADEAVDLTDRAGRLRRLAIAGVIGVLAGIAGYFVARALSQPDEGPANGVYTARHLGLIEKFVWSTTGFSAAIAFAIALAVQNHLARKK